MGFDPMTSSYTWFLQGEKVPFDLVKNHHCYKKLALQLLVEAHKNYIGTGGRKPTKVLTQLHKLIYRSTQKCYIVYCPFLKSKLVKVPL